ncbi:outer membrane beta-barrel protein [Hugenholtzia roseola]|uniref:outer membrane beta-barrel protein n=1 Tax=Hugenholtzia roseola TaxID=1002 RepID=UPI0003F9D682|nr:outer membrane beta-barrel protein [Hugenholtzia roseola]
MKKILLMLLFCIVLFKAKAQQHDYSSYSSEFYVGYSLVHFLNPTFSESRNNDNLNYGSLNIEAGMKFTNRFAQFNLSYIRNEYILSSGNPLLTENDVAFNGFEAGFSLFLSPITSKNFSPYLGVGYLGGSLSVTEPDDTSTTNTNGQNNNGSNAALASARISTPLWKFGIMAAYKRVSLNLEYRQTFLTPERAFHQASLSLGYRFIRED